MLASLTAYQWLVALAASSQLALAMLVSLQRRATSLRVPFVALCITLFCWNLASLAHALTGHRAFHHLDNALSPITVAAAVHFVAAFVGRRRKSTWVLVVFDGLFGVLSASAWAQLVGRRLLPRDVWIVAFLVGLAGAILLGGALLIRHARTRPEERRATLCVLIALVGGLTIGSTELVDNLGVPVPSLGAVGTLFAAVVLAPLVVGASPLGREQRGRALFAFGAAGLAVLLYLAVFRSFGNDALTLVLGTASLSLLLVVVLREVGTRAVRARQKRERLTWMGRMSEQLAHDLKNPLASLRGAVQLLQEDRRRGVSLDDRGDMVDLLDEQIERMLRVIEKYRRLGSIEPALRAIDLPSLTADVARLMRRTEVTIVQKHAELPRVTADPDLLMVAIENLLANAADASTEGGRVWLETSLDGEVAVIEVRDEGEGMDERTLEAVFDDFFTTKATGTGLGLSFVRRVMQEHGGDVQITSRVGEGTAVRLLWPIGGQR